MGRRSRGVLAVAEGVMGVSATCNPPALASHGAASAYRALSPCGRGHIGVSIDSDG